MNKKIDNLIIDEGCKYLNEILLINKSIKFINLGSNFFKINKFIDNKITYKGIQNLKESLSKTQELKKIIFDSKNKTIKNR
jgi:hypothetical protein